MKLTQETGVARYAKPLIASLGAGQSITIELPEAKFWRQQAANAIMGTAKYILGVGGYHASVRETPGSIVVRRT